MAATQVLGVDWTIQEATVAAQQDNAEAQFYLGRAYFRGEGVDQDIERAVRLFLQAAKRGDAKAQHNLGSCYLEGKGVHRSVATAALWYRRAAEQGTAMSQESLAGLLLTGQGVERNPVEAAKWLEMAAEQGSITAQAKLAQLYYFGADGLPADLTNARRWLEQCAPTSNNSWVHNTLGVMYEHGQAGEASAEKSIACYRKAAEIGDAKGQANLSRAYLIGLGHDADPVTAYAWAKVSHSRGEATAEKLLEAIDAQLTDDQRKDGEKLAEDLRSQSQPGARSAGSGTSAK